MSQENYDSAKDINPRGAYIPAHPGPDGSVIPPHFANDPEPLPIYPHDGQWVCSLQENIEWILRHLGIHVG